MLPERLTFKILTTCTKRFFRTFKICSSNWRDVEYVADLCAISGDIEPPTVIIVGGGVAGLSAAQHLVQCGITPIRILEATDRPGGRVKTCWLADTITEMGADKIVGASVANPVYTLAAQERLLKTPLQRLSDGEMLYFTSDGTTLNQSLVEKVTAKYWTMESKAANLCKEECAKQDPCLSLDTFLERLITVDLSSEFDRYNASRVFYGLMNSLSTRIGANLSEVSARLFGCQEELPGGSVQVDLGMGGILAPLVRGLPSRSEVYNKPVSCIRWGTAGEGCPRVVVRCCDGEEWCADYVIITVPLGVLKERADDLFCPPLPASKMDAIKNLGFGHIGKVFLEYKEPFFTNKSTFGLAWSPEELKVRDTWVKGISHFSSVSRKVLCAHVAGDLGKMMEHCCDDEVAEHITITLRRFLRDSSIPVPISVMRTDWSSNKHFNGGITYMGMKSGLGNIKDIATPIPSDCDDIPPILLFAGEHTEPRFYGTMHGARLSGLREAKRIIQLTKTYEGSPTKLKS